MSKLDNPIVVTVTGPTHSGKTHVLAVIQNALEQAGIPSSNIVVQGCDNTPESYMEIKSFVATQGVPEAMKGNAIHLVESYTTVPHKT